jgi:hypothetical protein
MTNQNFKKVIRPGSVKTYGERWASVYIEIEFIDGKLSLHGVVGPTRGGNALGGAGQIQDEVIEKWAPAWTPAMYDKLQAIWKEWHLNDMQAACTHQRAEGWGKNKVKIAHLKLNWNLAGKRQLEIKLRAEDTLRETGRARLTEDEQTLLNLSYSLDVPAEQVSQFADWYDTERIEEKSTGWLKESDHPEGVLSKPCPVCGYKYGSAWLREEVPADVLEWLRNLPDTDRQPAWV